MTETETETKPVRSRSKRGRVAKWALGGLAAIVALILIGVAVLNSPFGQRFIADEIAKVAPASGLRIEVGRIEGDIYGEATLHDVVLSDPKGPFLTIPLVELDWRPLSWITSGLDVRNLVARRGTLLRTPELLPGDPDAPILPDFDIRIDRFEIDRLTIAEGVVGETSPVVNLLAEADIRQGRVYLNADGRLGDRDRILALIDAEPDGDRFDIDLDYRAPADGVIAGLLGMDAGYTARIKGDGSWSRWDGAFVIRRDNERFAAFRIDNDAGEYGLLGQLYPSDLLTGLPASAVGETVSLRANGTLVDSVLDGRIETVTRALGIDGTGVIDLAANAFEDFDIAARLRDPALFGESLRLEDARLAATLDGAFRDLTIDHELSVEQLISGETSISGIAQAGTATYDGTRWTLPLDAEIARVVTGNDLLDPRLVQGSVGGTLFYTRSRLLSDDLRIAFADTDARLKLRGDTEAGSYALVGPVNLRGLPLENIGAASGSANIDFRYNQNAPWTLGAELDARIARITNATIENLAGPAIRLRGGVSLGSDAPINFRNLRLDSNKLTMRLGGTVREGRTSVAGSGTQQQYGAFTVEARLDDSGPNAVLVFADPLPAAGLKDVRVAISPSDEGFDIETEGQSMLGRFDGILELVSPQNGPTTIAIEQLNVWKTAVTGNLTLVDGGADGRLTLSGGGLDGRIGLAARNGGQGFAVDLDANSARFAGATPITIARADIEARGFLKDGSSQIDGSVMAEGVRYGSLFIGRLAAQADLQNGRGEATASLAGRRGSRFNLQLNAGIAPERIAVAARGEFAGRRINVPRRAVLRKQDDGGWLLERTQISYGPGALVASGEFGGGTTSLDLGLDRMPLSLVDVVLADLGLGGTVSGKIDYRSNGSGVPTGTARIKLDNLTRSGLVLSSKPIDVALVSSLGTDRLEARAVLTENGTRRGRLQARITGLPGSGGLYERLRVGDLFAQLRFNGPAAALWRLSGVEAFDITGPLAVAANVRGTIADPSVRGSLSGEKLRVQSSLSGTDIRNVAARGNFSGSRLRLSRFSGETANGGRVSGSGTIDLQNLGERGPRMDIKIAARNARLLNANGIDATITGPLRVVSDGLGGTIAGRVEIDRASWSLGSASSSERLPNIRTREINVPADIATPSARSGPWRYLIDARAESRIDVDGMGLDSEWRADILLRGTTDDPRIGGEAQVVRGDYTFAGTRFELTRGRIDFDANVPIDPRINIVAETESNGLDVQVSVQGNAQQPEISFSSTPLLPEEEILSRLLFGGSITELSATDALQLGAALASLRGGGGMDPINKLRSAIGLDRLRIVSADPALNRGTGVALGKNIGSRFYVEIITDGRGYSATETEFRVTSWLSLLASVSTIGRESVVAEISRDY